MSRTLWKRNEDGVELLACEPLVRGRAAIEQRYRTFVSGSVKEGQLTWNSDTPPRPSQCK